MLVLTLLAAPVRAQAVQKVSVASNGTPANQWSLSASISGDGRYIAFSSIATNLDPNDLGGVQDVFVRDREAGTTQLVSVASTGEPGNARSFTPSISTDGRFVVFVSAATNLVSGDTNGFDDVFCFDRGTGRIFRSSVSSGGDAGNRASSFILPFDIPSWYAGPAISSNGRFAAFVSLASNLAPGDSNGLHDVFVRDRERETTERVSVDSHDAEGNGPSGTFGLAISGDGRFVAFTSEATNLVANDGNDVMDIFVRDRRTDETIRVSLGSGDVEGDEMSWAPRLSADGRFTAFASRAGNWFPTGRGNSSIFVRDRETAVLERVSHSSMWCNEPSISSDGRFVAFRGTGFGWNEVYLRDRLAGTTNWMSRNLGDSAIVSDGDSRAPCVSADGRYVAFESGCTVLVPGDTYAWDTFVTDSSYQLASVCEPGTDGVMACPCSNPSGFPQTGCGNSSFPGGARLWGEGGAILSSDTLRFRGLWLVPNQLSMLSQWDGFQSTGGVFGMGVRCTTGGFLRLATATTAPLDGHITMPDLLLDEVQVSVRSATLGHPISAGATRWYSVLYRDPIVLGGCPASSTFNVTQTIEVRWSH